MGRASELTSELQGKTQSSLRPFNVFAFFDLFILFLDLSSSSNFTYN